MNLVALTEHLIKSLVSEPDMVSVKQFDDEDDMIVIQVLVNDSDMGAVIGRGGNIANAIRTIAQGVAYANGEKKVKVNINSI